MTIAEIYKKHKLLIISNAINTLITAGLTIYVGWYFFNESISGPKPTVIFESNRTHIVDKQSISQAPIKIYKSDNTLIDKDITAVSFYFWNDSYRPIKKENILEPLTIVISDTTGEILDYSITKLSRDVIDAEMTRSSECPLRKLRLSFLILERNDGFAGQLIFSGNPDTDIKIVGTIEGVEKIITNDTYGKELYFKYLAKVLVYLALGFVIMFVGGKLLEIAFSYEKSQSKLRRYVATILAWIFTYGITTVLILIVLIVMLAVIIAPLISPSSHSSANIPVTIFK